MCVVVWVCIYSSISKWIYWFNLLSLESRWLSILLTRMLREAASCSAICLKPIFTHQVIIFYNGRGINHFYKNKNKQKKRGALATEHLCGVMGEDVGVVCRSTERWMCIEGVVGVGHHWASLVPLCFDSRNNKS